MQIEENVRQNLNRSNIPLLSHHKPANTIPASLLTHLCPCQMPFRGSWWMRALLIRVLQHQQRQQQPCISIGDAGEPLTVGAGVPASVRQGLLQSSSALGFRSCPAYRKHRLKHPEQGARACGSPFGYRDGSFNVYPATERKIQWETLTSRPAERAGHSGAN